jgi:peptidoglycan/xylan/chitin deacetylase (PgdA/CDA1 family)
MSRVNSFSIPADDPERAVSPLNETPQIMAKELAFVMKSPLFFLALMVACFATPASAGGEDAKLHVALVFDDGPVPEQAEKLLSLFAEEKVRVTFAYVGKNAESHAATAKKALAAGHEMINHSYAHLHPKDLDDAALEHEIVGGQNALLAAVGTAPRWYWMPFAERDERMLPLLEKAQIAAYVPRNLVSSDDWRPEVDGDGIRQRATTGITDGTVILFHEWRKETLEQLPAILAELKRQNCVFLTFSELGGYVGTLK